MVKIKTFRREEVLAYLEDKIICGEADNNEIELYEQYVWDGFINELNYNTYKSLKIEMLNNWKDK